MNDTVLITQIKIPFNTVAHHRLIVKLPKILGKYGERLPFVAVVDFRGVTGSQPPGWGKHQPRGCKLQRGVGK